MLRLRKIIATPINWIGFILALPGDALMMLADWMDEEPAPPHTFGD